MNIDFPANCTNEGSRWSYSVKLNEILRLDHNAKAQTLPLDEFRVWQAKVFMPRVKAVMRARNQQIALAREGAFWNPRIPDHVSNGVIAYPPGLDLSNEGSRGSFLTGLEHKLSSVGKSDGDLDMVTVSAALSQAEIDAVNGDKWNPSLDDIEV